MRMLGSIGAPVTGEACFFASHSTMAALSYLSKRDKSGPQLHPRPLDDRGLVVRVPVGRDRRLEHHVGRDGALELARHAAAHRHRAAQPRELARVRRELALEPLLVERGLADLRVEPLDVRVLLARALERERALAEREPDLHDRALLHADRGEQAVELGGVAHLQRLEVDLRANALEIIAQTLGEPVPRFVLLREHSHRSRD